MHIDRDLAGTALQPFIGLGEKRRHRLEGHLSGHLAHAVVAGGNAVRAHFGLLALVPLEGVFPSAAALLSCASLAISASSPSRSTRSEHGDRDVVTTRG